MTPLRIAVILGSTRPNRKSETVAQWVVEQAQGREASYEIVDLRDHPMPHFDSPVSPARGNYESAATIEWATTIARYDGFIFVTPEYNHSTSSVLKNALDTIYAEWNNKAAGFVSYGSTGGVRAVEHLRQIVAELQIADVRGQVALSLISDWDAAGAFAPADRHSRAAEAMFTHVEAWAGALRAL